MNALFERFVLAWMQDHERAPYRVVGQHTGHLDTGRNVRLRPDICIYRGKKLELVLDTKYKVTQRLSDDAEEIATGSGAVRVHNSDVYQVLAYCRGFDTETGYLIFPDWESSPRSLEVKDGQNTIVLDGIRIGGSVEDMESDLYGLLRRTLADPASFAV
jgi:5-methylcytosine-specific restriction endonuclease McrBC regulatory subunit McrC